MIQVLATGGTIDKVYNPITGNLEFNTTHFPELIKIAKVDNIQIDVIFLKDSLDILQDGREQIFDFCQNSKYDKIIIAHGTDTIVETAKKLSTIKNKTIILFGAMIPYSIKGSDALFNFGFTTAYIQILEDGIYIAMNGKIFDFDKVQKDKKLGKFIKI